MARNTYESWIPEEFDSAVIMRVNQMSGAEATFSRVAMGTDTRSIPRSAGVDVESIAKGGTYGEDSSTNDDVTLTARKFGKAIRIAEEDIDDAAADIIATKQRDWSTSYAKMIDNATMAVTAAENGTTIPFTSLYKTLRTTASGLSYTADDNYVASATGANAVTYSDLSTVLGKIETGDYFDEGNLVVLAHPYFRKAVRGVLDDQHRPIFIERTDGTPDTVFGVQVRWCLGLKTSATALASPAGNPLLAIVNRDYMRLGVRSGPESIVIDGRNGLAALTDETILKMRARRAFTVGNPHAAAIYEYVGS